MPNRRDVLRLAGAAGATWLTGLADALAHQAASAPAGQPASSIIVLWLEGGPSQLETFDPHPGSRIAGGTRAIKTTARGVQIAEGLEQLADRMEHVALVRSVVSPEADHQRASYVAKTGYRPDPAFVHPSIGAVCCHELPVGGTEIPRHVSILSGAWPSRGGFLGDRYDPFLLADPGGPVPDVRPRVSRERAEQRFRDLAVVERTFHRGQGLLADATGHGAAIEQARRMMTSKQLEAFDVSREPASLRDRYGPTPFGRGCLAARRLIEVGVRCVEVTLRGWDSHVNNHGVHQRLVATLDPAVATLLDDLGHRDLWRQTVVLCGGEFGRTPTINRLEGRDHWPHGFSFALAGGPIRGGCIVGETDPLGGRKVHDPHPVADIHATLLAAVGLDPGEEVITPQGRPVKLSDGRPIAAVLRNDRLR